MGNHDTLLALKIATVILFITRFALSQSYGNEPDGNGGIILLTNNNMNMNTQGETPAQDRSLVPPYDINPYFGFRKYGEMRYEPLTMAYLGSPNSFLSGLLGVEGLDSYGRSGKAIPTTANTASNYNNNIGEQSRTGRSYNPTSNINNNNNNNNQVPSYPNVRQSNPVLSAWMNNFKLQY